MNHEQPKPAYHMERVIVQTFPGLKSQAFSFMNQLEGWCSEKKASILMDIILKTKPDTIVEIGVYGGKSLVPMACALKANGKGIIYGIDPWDNTAAVEGVENDNNLAYWSTIDLNAILQNLVLKIDQFGLESQIRLIKGRSLEVKPIPDIDILHIDGKHSDVTSYIDVTKWAPLVKSGGWIIFDDMTWYENGKFTNARAVDWLNTHCKKFAEFHDNCDWGIWVQP
jgi:predicted O-methyltransferase YrrM